MAISTLAWWLLPSANDEQNSSHPESNLLSEYGHKKSQVLCSYHAVLPIGQDVAWTAFTN